MKKLTIIFALVFGFLFFNVNTFAQDSLKVQNKNQVKAKVVKGKQTQRKGRNFVDKDGDGYNDNAPDHDGDGIPNGLDDDYNGAGKKGFVDLDGDGINDNAGYGNGNGNGNGFGARNGVASGNGLNKNAVSPQNGNANGPANGQNSGSDNTNGKTRKGQGGKGN